MSLRPVPHVTADDLARGQRALVQDAAWASLTGALYGGVILVGFALALGAGPFVIGLLAAIPLIAQSAQLAGIALVERLRQRKRITVTSVTVSRVIIATLAVIPFLPVTEARISYLIAVQVTITVLGSIAGCALNSWLHQLLPREGLGAFFAKRLFFATTLSCIGSLAAGYLVDHWTLGEKIHAYSVAFIAAALAGFVSSWFLTRVPEPVMTSAGPTASIRAKILSPFRDGSFRKVLIYIAGWNAASNLAAPFVAVYLMKQLDYSLGTVTTLWVASQVANALTLYLWGRLSDRLSNKAILAVALPAYFLAVFSLAFVAIPTKHAATLPALYLIHAVMGAAGGGISLATGNMSLKLAPQGQGTSYLAATSLVASITGGITPIVAGALAQWLEAVKFSILVRWALPGRTGEATVMQFASWEFLFALSAAAGLYALHALSRIDEGEEISERVVMQHFALEALRTVNQVSSVGGLLGNVFSFGRLIERRLFTRRRVTSSAERRSSETADV